MSKIYKIEIITRKEKFQELKDELTRIGVEGMTVYDVQGCGVQKGIVTYYRGVKTEIQLIPKIKIDIVVSEVPYENPVYSNINSVGRQWIFRYALALVRETLGYIRGKYSTVPIPDSEATLNQQDLLTDARAEKELLITQLRDMLDATSRAKQLEQKANETEFLEKTLKGVPMLVYIG